MAHAITSKTLFGGAGPRASLNFHLGLVIAVTCAGSAWGDDVSLEAAFKSFIESPPVIEKLVFEKSSPGREIPTLYHLLRWQPEAFLVRLSESLDRLDDLTPPAGSDRWVGRYEEHYWTVFPNSDGRGFVRTEWVNLPGPEDDRNQVRASSEDVFREACTVLTFGIPAYRPGRITWQGNRFYFTNQFLQGVEGELRTANGVPAGVALKLHNLSPKRPKDAPAVLEWLIEYRYDRSVAGNLPAEYSIFLLRENTAPWILNRFRILELQTTGKLLSREFFQPTSAISSVPLREWFVSNRVTFAHTSNGLVQVWEATDPRIRNPRTEASFSWIYALIAAILLAVPIGLTCIAKWRGKVRS